MNNIIVAKMNDIEKFEPSSGEIIPVRHFLEVDLENLKDLTPSRVQNIIDRFWSPDGFIAWNLNGSVLELVFFKGRAAKITKVTDETSVKDLLTMATSLGGEAKDVILSLCA